MLLRTTSCTFIGLFAGLVMAVTVQAAPELHLSLQLDWIGLHGLFGMVSGAVLGFAVSMARK